MPANGPLYNSFQEDFHRYYTVLCQYAFTILKDADLCEDIVQDVFLRIWDRKKELIGQKELRFYLFTAVRNNCLTALEKERKNKIVPLGDYDAPVESSAPLPETPTQRTFEELLSGALDQLPPKCREIFVLSRISKLTYQQIGDTLGISIKTVENQMGKALRVLRTFVKENSVLLLFFFFIAAGYRGIALFEVIVYS